MGRAATDSKEKLITTAAELIWQSGYGAVSVDDICHASGVKKGSFYHYFESKADLAVAALEAYFEEGRAEMDAVFASHVPPAQRFEVLVEKILIDQRAAAAKYGHVCGCPFATLGSELAGQDEKIRHKVTELFGRYKIYFIGTLQEMVRAGTLPAATNISAKADEIYTYLLGQVMMARIQNSLAALEVHLLAGLQKIIGMNQTASATEPA